MGSVLEACGDRTHMKEHDTIQAVIAAEKLALAITLSVLNHTLVAQWEPLQLASSFITVPRCC